MYTIFADDVCIYDSDSIDKSLKIISPKLVLANNSAGSFTCTIPSENIGYDSIFSLDTTFRIYKDGNVYWEGRSVSGDIDFLNRKKIVCEGPLSYLNDTVVPPKDYSKRTIPEFISDILTVHNNKVSVNRKIYPGTIDVRKNEVVSDYMRTYFTKTWDLFSQVLIEKLGGHLSIRYENNKRYLDYKQNYNAENEQIIEFGSNLLDLNKTFDESEYATVVVPIGQSLGTNPITGMEEYVTVEPVNDGSPYIVSQEAVTNHGRIEKTISFDSVSDPTILYVLGVAYLQDMQFNNLVLSINAVDLNLINPSIQELKLLDTIKIISKPHGMNKTFPVTRVDLYLDDPSSNTYTLGSFNSNDTISNYEASQRATMADQLNQLKSDNALEFYIYENKDDILIHDQVKQLICNIRFASKGASLVTFQAEIVIDIQPFQYNDETVEILYNLNGADLLYVPTDNFASGKHIISLYKTFYVQKLESYQWKVYIKTKGGNAEIKTGHLNATIWGDRLVGEWGWNGYIDLEDTITEIPLKKITVEPSLIDNVATITDIPYNPESEDTLGEINLHGGVVIDNNYNEILLLDKKMMSMYTHLQLSNETYAQINNLYIYG